MSWSFSPCPTPLATPRYVGACASRSVLVLLTGLGVRVAALRDACSRRVFAGCFAGSWSWGDGLVLDVMGVWGDGRSVEWRERGYGGGIASVVWLRNVGMSSKWLLPGVPAIHGRPTAKDGARTAKPRELEVALASAPTRVETLEQGGSANLTCTDVRTPRGEHLPWWAGQRSRCWCPAFALAASVSATITNAMSRSHPKPFEN